MRLLMQQQHVKQQHRRQMQMQFPSFSLLSLPICIFRRLMLRFWEKARPQMRLFPLYVHLKDVQQTRAAQQQ